MSLREIATEAECGPRTIARWMETHEIPTRDMVEMLRARDFSGENNPNWRNGSSVPLCDCGAPMAYTANTCRSCLDISGTNNPNWRGIADVMTLLRQWSHEYWRPAVFARDGYTCQQCGDSRGGNLHAHHIEPLSCLVHDLREQWSHSLDGPEDRLEFVAYLLEHPSIASIDNGVTLCEPCHQDEHRKTA